ncbi:hypothetical protein D3C86_1795460 [compost metagenome]
MPVQLAQRFLLPDKISLGTFGDAHNDHKAQRQCNNRDQSKPRANGQHHDNHTDNGHDRSYELCQTLLQRSADIVHIIGGPAENFPVGPGVKIFQRQPLQLAVDLLTHIKNNLLRHTGHYILLHITEQ